MGDVRSLWPVRVHLGDATVSTKSVRLYMVNFVIRYSTLCELLLHIVQLDKMSNQGTFKMIAPPFSVLQLIVKRRAGGHGTSLKKVTCARIRSHLSLLH